MEKFTGSVMNRAAGRVAEFTSMNTLYELFATSDGGGAVRSFDTVVDDTVHLTWYPSFDMAEGIFGEVRAALCVS